MPRLIAVIVALLALLGAGWWGWSNPDLLPESLRARLSGNTPEVAATRPAPRPAPATPEPAPAPAPQPLPESQPASPGLTPPPQNAPLPPETGSAMAAETERVAEAAIAAADARAEAQALARAEAEALEAAKQRLLATLGPLLEPEADPTALRDRLEGLAVPADPIAARVQSGLVAEITSALAEAEVPAAPDTAGTDGATAPTEAATATGTTARTPTALPAVGTALSARIKDLLK